VQQWCVGVNVEVDDEDGVWEQKSSLAVTGLIPPSIRNHMLCNPTRESEL
jgi:hypothetical protein